MLARCYVDRKHGRTRLDIHYSVHMGRLRIDRLIAMGPGSAEHNIDYTFLNDSAQNTVQKAVEIDFEDRLYREYY